MAATRRQHDIFGKPADRPSFRRDGTVTRDKQTAIVASPGVLEDQSEEEAGAEETELIVLAALIGQHSSFLLRH